MLSKSSTVAKPIVSAVMVVSLGPGKFYGSSLPRPWIYTDVKFNDERVDPPVSVLDPLLVWANEAHWSMGGLSFKRLRHQGRIEGSVKKLQAERESIARKKKRLGKYSRSPDVKASQGKVRNSNKRLASLTPPPAPLAAKRRKYMAVSEEEDDTEEEEEEATVVVEEEESESESSEDEVVVETKKKMPVRKLYDEFNKVAREGKRVVESNGVGGAVMKVVRDLNKEPEGGTQRKRKIGEKNASIVGTRTSPRLVTSADVASVSPIKTRRDSKRHVKRH